MKKLPVFLIGLMACLAIGITTARGQTYTLEDMGVVKGMDASLPVAINNVGHVAGTAYSKQGTCAFHYDYTQKLILDAGGLNSRAFGMSPTSLTVGDEILVGDSLFPSNGASSHAAMFIRGFAKDLGVLKGQQYSRANGVNAMGQVVGFSSQKRDSSESRAFMWSGPTGMIDIGTLGGAYAQANAINDAGYITGWAQTQSWGPIATTHAFIYQPWSPTYSQRLRDLGVLGGLYSYGVAINNYNHVAGYSTIKMSDERIHAFLHNGKSMIDLGSLSGDVLESDYSVALGVNNKDQVVGFTYLPAIGEMPLQQVAFLWSRNESGVGKMANLNSVLDKTGRNYLLISATGINDRGQIAAIAYDTYNGGLRAVLLTPLR
jgi:probable HAF family extracellular repeat protein